jgi:alpha-D-xyloside xylohydrolase
VWINPYIGQKSPVFNELKEKGYLLKRPDGSLWQWDKWQPGLAIYDFTNPEACKWYADKLKGLGYWRGLLQNRLWRAYPDRRAVV